MLAAAGGRLSARELSRECAMLASTATGACLTGLFQFAWGVSAVFSPPSEPLTEGTYAQPTGFGGRAASISTAHNCEAAGLCLGNRPHCRLGECKFGGRGAAISGRHTIGECRRSTSRSTIAPGPSAGAGASP